MSEEQHDRKTQPVTRGEFEAFRDQVLDALAAFGRKFDDQSKRGQWSIPQILAVITVLGTPLIFTVRNLYQSGETARVLADHLDFAEKRSAELTEVDAGVRERLRATEVKLIEGETQHKWIADVINTVHDYEARIERAYCSVCDRAGLNSRIVFPDRGYSPMSEIGEAKNGNGH